MAKKNQSQQKTQRILDNIDNAVSNIEDLEDLQFLLSTLHKAISRKLKDKTYSDQLDESKVSHHNLVTLSIVESIKHSIDIIKAYTLGLNSRTTKKLKSVENKSKTSLLKTRLPSELQEYEYIATNVIDLVKCFYQVKYLPRNSCKDIASWELTDSSTNQKAFLYLGIGFEWSLSAIDYTDELPEVFDMDFYEFCMCNDIDLEELYESLAS